MQNHTYVPTAPVHTPIHLPIEERFFEYSAVTFIDKVPGVSHLFFLALPV